jgi:hypothetical protein
VTNEHNMGNPAVVGASGYDPDFSGYEKIRSGKGG